MNAMTEGRALATTRGTTTALVTGASMGIGLELARVFAAQGHSLVLVARSEDKLRALAAELEARHRVSVLVVPADLGDNAAAERVFEAVSGAGIVVDYLVNNAGFGTTGPFLDADRARELEMVHVNVLALTHLTHSFARGMVQRRRGGVLNIASTAGFQPGPNMAVYYATKAYVVSFSEALAEELRGTGVHVTAYCPGPVATEFARTAGNAESVLFKRFAVATPDAVARGAYRALLHGRPLAVHGFMNWLGIEFLRISPRALVRRLVGFLNSKG
jgi:short-subunit dehydrogenase